MQPLVIVGPRASLFFQEHCRLDLLTHIILVPIPLSMIASQIQLQTHSGTSKVLGIDRGKIYKAKSNIPDICLEVGCQKCNVPGYHLWISTDQYNLEVASEFIQPLIQFEKCVDCFLYCSQQYSIYNIWIVEAGKNKQKQMMQQHTILPLPKVSQVIPFCIVW